jgi:hypothetical protein
VSQFLALLNRLKQEARLEWLTDSQWVACRLVQQQIRFPERVNLCGATGSGKTFLAWALTNELNAKFFRSPEVLGQSDFVAEPSRLAIVDNVVSDTADLRRLLAELQMRNLRSAILVTRQPNSIGLPIIPLPLPTPQDITVVYHNLSLLDQYAIPPLPEGNLWRIVRSTLSLPEEFYP